MHSFLCFLFFCVLLIESGSQYLDLFIFLYINWFVWLNKLQGEMFWWGIVHSSSISCGYVTLPLKENNYVRNYLVSYRLILPVTWNEDSFGGKYYGTNNWAACLACQTSPWIDCADGVCDLVHERVCGRGINECVWPLVTSEPMDSDLCTRRRNSALLSFFPICASLFCHRCPSVLFVPTWPPVLSSLIPPSVKHPGDVGGKFGG